MRAIGLTILILPTAAGCGDRARPAAAAGRLVVLVSGDTRGWIVPCGCASNQSGGLLRRGELVRRLSAGGAAVVVCDVGGAAGGDSEYQRLKFEAILDGEAAMGAAAHNLGETEIQLGPAEVRRLAARRG